MAARPNAAAWIAAAAATMMLMAVVHAGGDPVKLVIDPAKSKVTYTVKVVGYEGSQEVSVGGVIDAIFDSPLGSSPTVEFEDASFEIDGLDLDVNLGYFLGVATGKAGILGGNFSGGPTVGKPSAIAVPGEAFAADEYRQQVKKSATGRLTSRKLGFGQEMKAVDETNPSRGVHGVAASFASLRKGDSQVVEFDLEGFIVSLSNGYIELSGTKVVGFIINNSKIDLDVDPFLFTQPSNRTVATFTPKACPGDDSESDDGSSLRRDRSESSAVVIDLVIPVGGETRFLDIPLATSISLEGVIHVHGEDQTLCKSPKTASL